MVELTELALVRHGAYNHSTGHLTEQGEIQTDAAATELVRGRRFLGALILTSPVPRAAETAGRLRFVVGDEQGTLVAHRALQVAGEHPESMRNLRVMAKAAVESADPSLEYEGPLVVVTHLPLIAAMMGFEDADQVPYGSVHYYEGDGTNAQFRSEFERPLTSVLAMPRA